MGAPPVTCATGWRRRRNYRVGVVTIRYLPPRSILKRNHLAPIKSPWALNLMGSPRIDVVSFVALIAATTFPRLGALPLLQTDAIASSITCVAAYTGGPNVPKFGNFLAAATAISLSAGIALMSGPNAETYEPG